MTVNIVHDKLDFHLHGFLGVSANKDYAVTAFQLMERMWKIVRSNNLPNKGLNIWVYDPGDVVFAGVELLQTLPRDVMLEEKSFTLQKYAYYKHTGPYHLLKQIGLAMGGEIRRQGLESTLPYVELYGHWTKDESQLETELFMSLV